MPSSGGVSSFKTVSQLRTESERTRERAHNLNHPGALASHKDFDFFFVSFGPIFLKQHQRSEGLQIRSIYEKSSLAKSAAYLTGISPSPTMSGNNNNNNNNNGSKMWSSSSSSQQQGGSDPVCSQCHQSCSSSSATTKSGTFSTFNNNNNNGGGSRSATPPYGVPPIQVTAKVLFGSVSAISALNAERKKKS